MPNIKYFAVRGQCSLSRLFSRYQGISLFIVSNIIWFFSLSRHFPLCCLQYWFFLDIKAFSSFFSPILFDIFSISSLLLAHTRPLSYLLNHSLLQSLAHNSLSLSRLLITLSLSRLLLAHSVTCSKLSHSVDCLLTPPVTCSITLSPSHLLIHYPSLLLSNSLTQSLAHSPAHSVVCSIILSLSHVFPSSLFQS